MHWVLETLHISAEGGAPLVEPDFAFDRLWESLIGSIRQALRNRPVIRLRWYEIQDCCSAFLASLGALQAPSSGRNSF